MGGAGPPLPSPRQGGGIWGSRALTVALLLVVVAFGSLQWVGRSADGGTGSSRAVTAGGGDTHSLRASSLSAHAGSESDGEANVADDDADAATDEDEDESGGSDEGPNGFFNVTAANATAADDLDDATAPAGGESSSGDEDAAPSPGPSVEPEPEPVGADVAAAAAAAAALGGNTTTTDEDEEEEDDEEASAANSGAAASKAAALVSSAADDADGAAVLASPSPGAVGGGSKWRGHGKKKKKSGGGGNAKKSGGGGGGGKKKGGRRHGATTPSPTPSPRFFHLMTSPEGMSGWLQSFKEAARLSVRLGRVLVMPCVRAGVLAQCVPDRVLPVPDEDAASTVALAVDPALDARTFPAFSDDCPRPAGRALTGARHRSFPLNAYFTRAAVHRLYYAAIAQDPELDDVYKPGMIDFAAWHAQRPGVRMDAAGDVRVDAAAVHFSFTCRSGNLGRTYRDWTGPYAFTRGLLCLPRRKGVHGKLGRGSNLDPAILRTDPKWVRSPDIFALAWHRGRGGSAGPLPKLHPAHIAAARAWAASLPGAVWAPTEAQLAAAGGGGDARRSDRHQRLSYGVVHWRSETLGKNKRLWGFEACAAKVVEGIYALAEEVGSAHGASPVAAAAAAALGGGVTAGAPAAATAGVNGTADEDDAAEPASPPPPPPPPLVLAVDLPHPSNPCVPSRYYGGGRGVADNRLRPLMATGVVHKYDADWAAGGHWPLDAGVVALREYALSAEASAYATCNVRRHAPRGSGLDAVCKRCSWYSEFVLRVVQHRERAGRHVEPFFLDALAPLKQSRLYDAATAPAPLPALVAPPTAVSLQKPACVRPPCEPPRPPPMEVPGDDEDDEEEEADEEDGKGGKAAGGAKGAAGSGKKDKKGGGMKGKKKVVKKGVVGPPPLESDRYNLRCRLPPEGDDTDDEQDEADEDGAGDVDDSNSTATADDGPADASAAPGRLRRLQSASSSQRYGLVLTFSPHASLPVGAQVHRLAELYAVARATGAGYLHNPLHGATDLPPIDEDVAQLNALVELPPFRTLGCAAEMPPRGKPGTPGGSSSMYLLDDVGCVHVTAGTPAGGIGWDTLAALRTRACARGERLVVHIRGGAGKALTARTSLRNAAARTGYFRPHLPWMRAPCGLVTPGDAAAAAAASSVGTGAGLVPDGVVQIGRPRPCTALRVAAHISTRGIGGSGGGKSLSAAAKLASLHRQVTAVVAYLGAVSAGLRALELPHGVEVYIDSVRSTKKNKKGGGGGDKGRQLAAGGDGGSIDAGGARRLSNYTAAAPAAGGGGGGGIVFGRILGGKATVSVDAVRAAIASSAGLRYDVPVTVVKTHKLAATGSGAAATLKRLGSAHVLIATGGSQLSYAAATLRDPGLGLTLYAPTGTGATPVPLEARPPRAHWFLLPPVGGDGAVAAPTAGVGTGAAAALQPQTLPWLPRLQEYLEIHRRGLPFSFPAPAVAAAAAVPPAAASESAPTAPSAADEAAGSDGSEPAAAEGGGVAAGGR
jgi:hypothetical protein